MINRIPQRHRWQETAAVVEAAAGWEPIDNWYAANMRRWSVMCRWLAYSGSPVPLSEVLYTPIQSFIDQSLPSKLRAETTNGDGFGVGWYDGRETPGIFRSIEPAWND